MNTFVARIFRTRDWYPRVQKTYSMPTCLLVPIAYQIFLTCSLSLRQTNIHLTGRNKIQTQEEEFEPITLNQNDVATV